MHKGSLIRAMADVGPEAVVLRPTVTPKQQTKVSHVSPVSS